ncbi:MAG: hypothetical protein ABI647_12510 [Gemmatimonadota bacterium]
MATSVLERPATGVRSGQPSLARTIALEWTVPVVLFASTAIIIGLHWDIAWHRSIGRDTFWSPPHIMEQVAAAMAGLFCGWRVIYTSFLGTDADRSNAVRFWRYFYGPLGGWVCIWGTIAMITSAPFDNWWHAAYGLDVKILTPPHVFLLLGMVTVQLGAMLMMLSEQNRAPAASARHGVMFAASMGLIVLMVATMVYAETGLPNMQHAPKFYTISAGIFTLFLVAVARAGKIRWSATVAAITYMAIMIVMNWVLALVPATPKLAPIYNPVTHLVAPGFPIILVLPAIVIDVFAGRDRKWSDWAIAPAVGFSFVVLLVSIQWPLSTFLLTLDQPNYLFGVGSWDYSSRLGPWTKMFFDVPGLHYAGGAMHGSIDVGAMVKGMGLAMVVGAISARFGLWWGTWMRMVRR